MSSTTRAGFLVPDVTDFGDQILYYDNNVTVFENELPSALVSVLPGSGNYTGRVRTTNTAQNIALPSPNKPYDGWMYNGAWGHSSPAGMRSMAYSANMNDGGNINFVNTQGQPENFSPVPLFGFNTVQGYIGGILKFCFLGHVDLLNSSDGTCVGAANIFLNPSSTTQPTPTTPGAIRLQTPIIFGNNSQLVVGPGDENIDFTEHFYGEMLYPCTANSVMGAAAYFSLSQATQDVALTDPETEPLSAQVNACGLMLSIEVMGTFSG